MNSVVDEYNGDTQLLSCLAFSRMLRQACSVERAEAIEEYFRCRVMIDGTDAVCDWLTTKEQLILSSPDADCLTTGERKLIRQLFATLRGAARYLDAKGIGCRVPLHNGDSSHGESPPDGHAKGSGPASWL